MATEVHVTVAIQLIRAVSRVALTEDLLEVHLATTDRVMLAAMAETAAVMTSQITRQGILTEDLLSKI